MSKIAIFVSHRTDLDSVIVPNPIYHHVLCGAYDIKERSKKLRDDIGDNISEKKPYYSEYTVQYWAWKNYDADYYGLCHYRRYLSFAPIHFPEWNEQRFAAEEKLCLKNMKKYGLLNMWKMKREIEKYDVTTSITYETKNVPIIPPAKNVKELMTKHPGLLTSVNSIDMMTEIIKEKYPEYYKAYLEELESNLHRGFNCFVMKKELFERMCTFEFGVLFELEKKLNLKNKVENAERELGYLGEILYGTFIRWVQMQGIYKVKERQIVLFLDTQKEPIKKNLYMDIKKILRKFLPAYRCTLRMENEILQQQATIARMENSMIKMSQELEKLNQREMATFWSVTKQFPKDLKSTKINFWRYYPKAAGDLRIVQSANATLLRNLKMICDELKIKFWLHGGTLIGGLRHEGFVPWDDDIDIAMMRNDYEKLKAFLCDSNVYQIKEYYYIQLGCRSYRFSRKDIDTNCFVDIFLYDYYSLSNNNALIDWESITRQKIHLKKSFLNLCHKNKMYPQDPTLTDCLTLKNDIDILIDSYIKHLSEPSSGKWILWGIDNNFEDINAYAWQHGRLFKYDEIFPLKECTYEEVVYNIPSDYEKYAYAEYGIDWMDIPQNMGQAVHWKQYFSDYQQIEIAKKIIEEGIVLAY